MLASSSRRIVLVAGILLAGACDASHRPRPDSPTGNPAQDAVTSTGTIELQLANQVGLDSLDYAIAGPNQFASSGTLDLSSASTISGTIGGIPAGFGFTILLSGRLTDGSTACSGTSTFTVVERMTTIVPVHILCFPTPNGSISVSGTINLCPVIDMISPASTSAFVGDPVAFTATVRDLDAGPAPLTFSWTASSGTFDDPSLNSPLFTCTAPGNVIVGLRTSDGDPGCATEWAVTLSCSNPDCITLGSGTTAYAMGSERAVDPTDGDQAGLALAHQGDQYLALWQQVDRGKYGARALDASGQSIGPTHALVANPIGQVVSLAGGLGRYMATWYDQAGDVLALPLGLLGEEAFGSPRVLVSQSSGSRFIAPIDFDGSAFRTVIVSVPSGFPSWDASIAGIFVDLDGSRLPGKGGVPGGGFAGDYDGVPTIGCRPGRCLTAYRNVVGMFSVPTQTYLGGSFDGQPPTLHGAVPGTTLPAVAFGNGIWLVAWQSPDQVTHAIRLSDASGAPLDGFPDGLVLGQQPATGFPASPAVTFSGGQFVVAWEGANGAIRLGRVTTDGAVLDPGGLVGPQGSGPVLSGDLLGYTRDRVYVRRLSLGTDGPHGCDP